MLPVKRWGYSWEVVEARLSGGLLDSERIQRFWSPRWQASLRFESMDAGEGQSIKGHGLGIQVKILSWPQGKSNQ